jgi:hypothetical protein
MSKARDLANAADVLDDVSATEIGYLDGVTSAIQTQLDAKTAKSTLTTTGDIYYASAANTPARLGIGTASQLLAVNSGATAPEWVAAPSSGGMTLISTTTLSGASVSLSSIPATYNHLQLIFRDLLPATNATRLLMRLNGDSNANRYITVGWQGAAAAQPFEADSIDAVFTSLSNSVSENLGIVNVYDYTNAVTWKYGTGQGVSVNSSDTTQITRGAYHFMYNQTAAISSIDFLMSSGNFTSGTVLLYGVK